MSEKNVVKQKILHLLDHFSSILYGYSEYLFIIVISDRYLFRSNGSSTRKT